MSVSAWRILLLLLVALALVVSVVLSQSATASDQARSVTAQHRPGAAAR